jgi:succinyl-CoA synthetase alpha subunit
MNMTVIGRTISSPSQSSTDVWVAPQLDGIMDPSSRPTFSAPTGPMAELAKQMMTAYGKMRKGLMLKRVTTVEGGTGDHKHTTTMTTTITNVKKAPISASVFEVPASYAKVEILDAIGAGAQAQAAAAQAHKPE